MMSEEMKAKREMEWWEYYPLHKWWCNDYCPLVPRFKYRPGDEYNANNWSFHWLIFSVWSMEHFSFGVDAGLSFDEFYVGAIFPYLRVVIGVRHMYSKWQFKLAQTLRRKPALKNDEGEYN